MKIIKSPLILHDFYVLESKCKFNDTPQKNKINTKKLFESYNLDFNFTAKKQNSGEIFLFCKISINDIDSPLPGYIIFIESVTILGFNVKANLTEHQKAEFVFGSGLSIAINNLRSHISNITAIFPFNKYQLPAIDVSALHKEKRKDLAKKKKS